MGLSALRASPTVGPFRRSVRSCSVVAVVVLCPSLQRIGEAQGGAITYELFDQRSVAKLSQIEYISPPIKLFDVDVVDVAAAHFYIVYTLHFDIHIYLHLYILSGLI